MSSLNTASLNLPAEPQVGSDTNLSGPHGCAREIVFRALDELRLNPRNARTHQKRTIRNLADNILKVGFIGAIIIDENRMILAGHARYTAAKLLGFATVPTIRVNGLNEAQKRVFVLADNKFAERAGWDREILAQELKDLSIDLPAVDLDVSLTGFELGEIEVLLEEVGDEKPEPEDRLPTTAGPAVTLRGDLWQLGNNCVLCGDARDRSDSGD